MKLIIFFLVGLITLSAFAQEPQLEHPRVMELEDKLVKEASGYFSRRFPGEPVFIKVDIIPLRRTAVVSSSEEALPYHDSETDEFVDEWDDPTTSLTALRNRVVKVIIDVSVPVDYDDQKVADIKQELSVYLRLIPYRDDVRIEKKLKVAEVQTPQYVYYVVAGIVLATAMLGLALRWSLTGMKTASAAPASSGTVSSMPSASAPNQNSFAQPTRGKTDVQGDVTFHDPIKTLDIVHIKLGQIEQSNTFPTLKDIMSLDELCKNSNPGFGALIYEFKQSQQKNLFKVGRDSNWLQAFSSPGSIDQATMKTLDLITREREFSGNDREAEDLLIQVWRMGDKASSFFKNIDQEHALIILGMIPKSVSLQIAKKTFPGSWGKLLDNRTSNVLIDPKMMKEYLRKALEIMPWFASKLLENYKRDKELLTYLNKVSIDDEKDIYETLQEDSFILKVRPGFYRVFELEDDDLAQVIGSFPLEKWALVLINSSRNYIKLISDKLDDKKKMVLSTHLKRLDQTGINFDEQNSWKTIIATDAQKFFKKDESSDLKMTVQGEESESQKHTA